MLGRWPCEDDSDTAYHRLICDGVVMDSELHDVI